MGIHWLEPGFAIQHDSFEGKNSTYNESIHFHGFEEFTRHIKTLTPLPRTITKSFMVNGFDGLIDLGGQLEEVNGNYFIEKCNKLKTLVGGPKFVGGAYKISSCNSLTNLDGFAKSVKSIDIDDCYKLTSLIGCENTSVSILNVHNCKQLKTFEGFPKHIKQWIDIKHCGFTSFVGIHKHIKSMERILYITNTYNIWWTWTIAN